MAAGAASPELEQRLFDLAVDGFTVIPSVLPVAVAQQIREEVLSLHPGCTRGHSCFVNFSQAWTQYLVEPRVSLSLSLSLSLSHTHTHTCSLTYSLSVGAWAGGGAVRSDGHAHASRSH